MRYTLVTVLVSLFISGCGVLGQRYGEEALYATLFSDGDYEIRLYESLIIAQTASEGGYLPATRSGYQRLTDYVSGNNFAQQTVSVNAPQAAGVTKSNIELTTPYYEEFLDGVWLTSVAMPEQYSLATLPKPADGSITFETLPRMKAAVITFSGYRSERLITSKANQLLQWVRQENLQAISPPRSVIFDSPLTIPGLRRHEIHINVK